MLQKMKIKGKDIPSAIAQGLREMHLRRDQVEVKVLEEPRKGFLGIGAKPALVELRQKRWSSKNLDAQIYMDVPTHRHGGRKPGRGRKDRNFSRAKTRRSPAETAEVRERTPKANEPQLLPSEAIQHAVIPENLVKPMAEAKEHLLQVLTHMGVKVENLNAWWDEKQQRILLTFDCDKPAIVIGKEGKTLEAIQYLCTLAVTRHFDKPISVVADTQNYWRKAEDKIDSDIEYGIGQIKRGASVFRFRPMSAQQRRYIHRAVDGNPYVQTASEGEGKWRKVTFRPTQQALDEAKANIAPDDFVPGVIGEDIPENAAENGQAAQEVAADTTPVQTEGDGPTQRLASETVAQTVTHTVVENQEHSVEEHSVVVTTQFAQPMVEQPVQPVATENTPVEQVATETAAQDK